MKSQCSFFHTHHLQDRVQTPWCFTPKVFQELSCAPPGSFLNNSPCEEESLGPGKPNNQQLIPRLGTHGPAFNQAAASAHDSLLLHLLLSWRTSVHLSTLGPTFSTMIIVSEPYVHMSSAACGGWPLHLYLFPPSDFISYYLPWPSFYYLAVPSLRAFPLALLFT